jgi:hypothetical protein
MFSTVAHACSGYHDTFSTVAQDLTVTTACSVEQLRLKPLQQYVQYSSSCLQRLPQYVQYSSSGFNDYNTMFSRVAHAATVTTVRSVQ